MLWRHRQTPRRGDDDGPSGLTLGQRFDLGDTAIDILSRGIGGSKNPLNWLTGTAAALDVSISAGTARRGRTVSAGVSAVAAQAAGMGGFVAGSTAGEILGTFLMPGVGTFVGGIVGGGIGSLVGDKMARTGTQRAIRLIDASRPRVRFGGNFRDSQPAYTMRQKAEQELGGSLLNARRYLGREAQLMHQ